MTNRIVIVGVLAVLAAGGVVADQDKPRIVNKPPPFVEGGNSLGCSWITAPPCRS